MSDSQPPTKRRSKVACSTCHARKVKCNVASSGVPCSNCADSGLACVIRRRKNQRVAPALPENASFTFDPIYQEQSAQRSAGVPWTQTVAQPEAVALPSNTDLGHNFDRRQSNDTIATDVALRPGSDWQRLQGEAMYWSPGPGINQPLSDSISPDFSHLVDLDDIFTFTSTITTPVIQQAQPNFTLDSTYTQNGFNQPSVLAGGNGSTVGGAAGLTVASHIPQMAPQDFEYLKQQGCFDLPPTNAFRRMMQLYFRMVHPNLPIVAEDEFWSLWHGEDFHLGQYSLLLLRAMIFAATSYTEMETLSGLGFANKRDARGIHYRLAKLLYDFDIERDPIANAQTCLLLTYRAPNHNILRVNGYWLENAIRFARIARADVYYRVQDLAKAKLLKRLWWGVLFRDRILSLGLRRSLNVEFRTLDSDADVLQASDFDNEIGRSLVHDTETQLRVVEVITATCRLMQCLTPVLQQLYRYERLDDRLDVVSQSLSSAVADIQRSLDALQAWHDRTIRIFPFPVSLDDAHETICIYANVLFSYHASAVFALNVYLILIHEALPAAKSLISIEEARESLQLANHDITQRTQELVQVRLVKFLPITSSALLALPLVLQAINVAAARGSGSERSEMRKLDVFTRTFTSQQENFDGSDFCAELLTNIVAYVQDEETFVGAMTNWRDSRDSNSESRDVKPGSNKVRVDWANLVYKKPRLFLRLVLYLDYAFCTGGPPRDEDFPPQLQRGGM